MRMLEIIDPLGHVALMTKGYDYSFIPGPDALEYEGAARRALFRQYQDYPANSVQGRGQLVAVAGIPAEPWRVTQPAQVVQQHVPIVASLQGGGVDAGQFVMQPLINTNP